MTRLFVYGSLLPGEANEVRLAGARLLGLARTVARYRLVDCGAWPGLLEGGATSVLGALFEVDDALLSRLDAFEGHPELFRRTSVALEGGGAAEAYLLATPGLARSEIPSGDFRAHARTAGPYLVVGCGFTGARVARALAARGAPVVATSREPRAIPAGVTPLAFDALEPASLEALAAATPPGARVLLSVPVLDGPGRPVERTAAIVAACRPRATRFVYLSTTGVYGDARVVDERTAPAPATERTRLRLEAEAAVRGSGVSSLVLRPAAIYGPGRGVHVAVRAGRHRIAGDGGGFVSRIHVDDLAALGVAALAAALEGAFPVADDEPETAAEIARFCARLVGAPPPPHPPPAEAPETLRGDRRVDGRAIRAALGVSLAYPSYRTGVPAALAAEG